MNLKDWLLTVRTPFLLLSVILVCVGGAAAGYEGFFIPSHFLLALLGLILAHISVNTLNEYFDFKTGIDFHTVKTPFSGGSGVLPAGRLKPASVYRLGVLCLALAAIIGAYFVAVKGWMLLPILLLGGFFTAFYSNLLSRAMLGEVSAGLGLGVLPVLGAYYVHTGFYSWEAAMAAFPCGLLTFNLLLLNEFPDVEADRKGGRRNLVIRFGLKGAAWIYSLLTAATYLSVLAGVWLGLLPPSCLLAFLTLPFAFKAVKGAFQAEENEKLIEGLKANVLTVLGTQSMLALGFFLASLVSL